MSQPTNMFNSIGPEDSNGTRFWKDTVNLLKLMKVDYQGARQQLEQMNLRIEEKEALVNQRIQQALLSSQGYNTLRLVKYSLGSSICQMGSVVLGGISHPGNFPVSLQIEVRCLGHFEVQSGSKKIVRWPSSKAKSIFQYLLIKSREPTQKDKLIEALWPGCAASAANNNLKAAVHSLRLSLNEISLEKVNQPIVLFSEGSYRLNPDICLSIDVDDFEKYRDNGRRLEKERRIEEAIEEYEKAENLYRGDYLEDELYEDWTLIRRETLKDNYLTILSKLAEYSLMTCDYENCIYYSQKIIAKDHSREDSYRNIIRCHIKMNQRNRALRWYEICCQSLQMELDTTPERETIELGESIMNHEINRG
jgi:DNA-binding SARP family transcriptional activator